MLIVLFHKIISKFCWIFQDLEKLERLRTKVINNPREFLNKLKRGDTSEIPLRILVAKVSLKQSKTLQKKSHLKEKYWCFYYKTILSCLNFTFYWLKIGGCMVNSILVYYFYAAYVLWLLPHLWCDFDYYFLFKRYTTVEFH